MLSTTPEKPNTFALEFLQQGIYVSKSPILVDFMYARPFPDGSWRVTIMQKILSPTTYRELMNATVNELLNCETYFRARTPEYYEGTGRKQVMIDNGIQFSIMDSNTSSAPGYTICDDGHSIFMSYIMKKDDSYEIFGNRNVKADNFQRHPMSSRLYHFIPLCDGECEWFVKTKRKLFAAELESVPGVEHWMIQRILEFVFPLYDYESKFITKRRRRRSITKKT